VKNQLQFILYRTEENEEYDYIVGISLTVNIVAGYMTPGVALLYTMLQ
jgi:hypothetical protein